MKLGIVFCAYNEKEYVLESVNAFIEAKKRHNIVIADVSIPFKEYNKTEYSILEDGTVKIIIDLANQGLIDKVFIEPKFILESEVRNLALEYLKEQKCDYIFIVDADELYSQEDIDKIVNFIKFNNLIDCFKINFKNYIFDGNEWIDGFCPFRIFRTLASGGIKEFYWDNDVIFHSGKKHEELSTIIIPKNISHIKHMTWVNNKGKRKVEYQMKHFGLCSYKWNEKKQTLEFNEEYYNKYPNQRNFKIYKD